MDGAGLEAEMMFKAGATHVVVMSQAHWASVVEMVKTAKSFGGQVMADVLNAPDKAEAARRMQECGVDWIIVHTGFDERRHVEGRSPLNDLPSVLNTVTIPVQAVGGLSIDQALECVKMGASSLVIGAPLAIRGNEFAASDEYEAILRDVVKRVKTLSNIND
jgi:3-hexulose-6-phosphate synthase/6-phospho-3-hexuloisomerase